eukprot:414131-Hanusia_phi.AAC.2
MESEVIRGSNVGEHTFLVGPDRRRHIRVNFTPPSSTSHRIFHSLEDRHVTLRSLYDARHQGTRVRENASAWRQRTRRSTGRGCQTATSGLPDPTSCRAPTSCKICHCEKPKHHVKSLLLPQRLHGNRSPGRKRNLRNNHTDLLS